MTVGAIALLFAVSSCKKDDTTKPDTEKPTEPGGNVDPNATPLKISITDLTDADEGPISDIRTIKATIYYESSSALTHDKRKNHKEASFVLATAPMNNGVCSITVPGSVDGKYLDRIAESLNDGVSISNENAKWGTIYLDAYDAAGNLVGYVSKIDVNNFVAEMDVYVDTKVTISGPSISFGFNKGWNVLYFNPQTQAMNPESPPDPLFMWILLRDEN